MGKGSSKSSSLAVPVHDHIEYTWFVKDFSALPRRPTSPGAKHYSIFSVPFTPPGNNELPFVMELYPYGDSEEYKDYVGIYLRLVKWTEKEVQVSFTLAILKPNGQVFGSRTNNNTFTKLTGWGWNKFIKRDELLSMAREVLLNDVLLIRCVADVIYVKATNQNERLKHLSTQCTVQLSQDWSSLLATGKGSDVTFVVEGKQIKAHKLVLSTRSPVFEAMFENDFLEKKDGKVQITDFDLDVFEEFLRFLYTGKVTIGENGFELMAIADKYAIESLKSLCEEYISLELTLDTVVPILVKAEMHSADNLKDQAIKFVVSNLSSIGQTANWDAALEAQPKLYSEVVRQIAKASKPY